MSGFRGSLRPLLLNTLNEGLAEHGDLFRADTIQSYLQLHMERRANLGYHLWGLMILFLWMKRWRISIDAGVDTKNCPS